MQERMILSSEENPQIRMLKKLESKKGREAADLFLAEGERLVQEIVSPWQIDRLVISESFAQKRPEFISTLDEYAMQEARVLTVTDALFQKIALTEHPQGVMAAVRQRHDPEEILLTSSNPFIIILENLQDPGNMGTVLRSADASGASGVLMGRGCVDPFNPKTVRSSMGAVFHLPMVQSESLTESVERLKKAGIHIFAAHLQGSILHFDADYTDPCGIMIGNEGNGLSDEITALADTKIRIPQPGRAESLNASVAAGILMYEVVRQRMTIY